jgi:hypothetical protein
MTAVVGDCSISGCITGLDDCRQLGTGAGVHVSWRGWPRRSGTTPDGPPQVVQGHLPNSCSITLRPRHDCSRSITLLVAFVWDGIPHDIATQVTMSQRCSSSSNDYVFQIKREQRAQCFPVRRVPDFELYKLPFPTSGNEAQAGWWSQGCDGGFDPRKGRVLRPPLFWPSFVLSPLLSS